MFFALSKVFWYLVQPLHLIALLALAALGLKLLGRGRAAAALAVCALSLTILVGYLPIPGTGLRILEDRFPRPDLGGTPPDGIIVLGGALVAGPLGIERGAVPLNGQAERLTEAVVLAERYPDARLVFTGGSGSLNPEGATEAELARRFFAEQGIDPERMVLETRSRNTYENAVNTQSLVDPAAASRWLLVTSALHMPRSMGVFRARGWEVIPYPVDYKTSASTPGAAFDLHVGAELAWFAAHEWIGLIAYRVTGRTGQLLPGPSPAGPG